MSLPSAFGAVGALVGEIAADVFLKGFLKDQLKNPETLKDLSQEEKEQLAQDLDRLKQTGVDFGKPSAGLVAAFAGLDIDDAATSADNAARNNAVMLVPITLELMDKGLQACDAYRFGVAISEGDTDKAAETAVEAAAGAATDAIPGNVILVKIGVALKKAGLGALASKIMLSGSLKNAGAHYSSLVFRGIPKDSRAVGLAVDGTKIKGVKQLYDIGKKKYIDVVGDIDLQPTLDRIEKGIKYPHKNDGSVFRNRDLILPINKEDYYTEFVVPTDVMSGVGPQRIIKGDGGEVYYTSDHYKTFIRVE